MQKYTERKITPILQKITKLSVKATTLAFDFVDWDQEHFQVIPFIALVIIMSIATLPRIFSFQWFLFVFGLSIIAMFNYSRGLNRGIKMAQKVHNELFMCFPKELLTEIKEHEELLHQHHQHTQEDEEDRKKNLN